MKNKTAYYVSTTHWDREWYWTQERFRIRLVELIDDLIKIFEDEPRYKYYMLDGQTIPIDDYLEIKPENENKIKNLVKEGRLLLGPWYILPDLFLVSGESIIRNLFLGHKYACRYGGVMDVGYLPDSFSHIAQMPQILNGFNFKEYFFMRGMGKEYEDIGTEFYWDAPDGSRVFTTYLIEGYFNGGGLGFHDPFIDFRNLKPDSELAYQKTNEMMKKMQAAYKSDKYLFFNGSDHTSPQKELPDLLEELNGRFDDIYFKHSTLREYLDDRMKNLEALPVFKGEFTGNYHHLIVRSVFSSRMYLKQMNFQSQNLLEKYAEPLSCFAFLEKLNDYTVNTEYMWKTLLKNHPHDSICGCSTDEVHKDMVNRFARTNQVGEYIINKSIQDISSKINTSLYEGEPILIYNPMNWERNEVVRAEILVPFGMVSGGKAEYNLMNFEGKSVPFQILKMGEKFLPELNNWKKFDLIEIEFLAYTPSLGYSIYYFSTQKAGAQKTNLKVARNSIENEFYKVNVNKNGSLKVFNKHTKEVFNGFNIFEDTEDDGDEYTYSFIENSKTFRTDKLLAKVSIHEKNLLSATLKVENNFRLPESIEPERTKRSKKMVANKIISFITLKKGCDRIEIKTVFENNSRDHRLRVLFPTNFKDYSNYADGHFNVIERQKYFPHKPKERGKIEYYSTQHQSNFVTICDNKSGITIANKGLPEYEILKENSTLAITLLRCIGWLNKNNLMTRWRMAGPDIETPDAQCIGENIFEYSIILHKKSWENSYKSSYNYCAPVLVQSVPRSQGILPNMESFISFSSDSLIISSIKSSEDKKGIILRSYNIKTEEVESDIKFYKNIEKCFYCDFLENILDEIQPEQNKITLSVPGKKIITLKIILED